MKISLLCIMGCISLLLGFNGSEKIASKANKTTEKQTKNNSQSGFDYEVQASKKDREIVERLLAEFLPQHNRFSKEALVIAVARKFIGTPYIAHTLDKNKDEKLVVNLREMDCTTYLENVIAICLCVNEQKGSFQDFVRNLCRVRYRNSVLSHTNRLHYYQWWATNNEQKGILKEIVCNGFPFTATQQLKINYMSENPQLYFMLKNSPDRIVRIKQLEDQTNGTIVRYIPKTILKNPISLKGVIQNGDIIALVTNKKNLDTTHLGFALWKENQLYLLNASSLKKNGRQVVEPVETLYQYLMDRSHNTGIRIARLQ